MSLSTLGSPLKAAVVVDDSDSVLKTLGTRSHLILKGLGFHSHLHCRYQIPTVLPTGGREIAAWYDLTKSE